MESIRQIWDMEYLPRYLSWSRRYFRNYHMNYHLSPNQPLKVQICWEDSNSRAEALKTELTLGPPHTEHGVGIEADWVPPKHSNKGNILHKTFTGPRISQHNPQCPACTPKLLNSESPKCETEKTVNR